MTRRALQREVSTVAESLDVLRGDCCPSQKAERELEARERNWMASEDSNSQQRRTLEKLWEPGAFSSSPYLSSLQR